ncbi:hypothetical protein N184_11480 [Sinorhizobium sp. GL28]|nr:hypothetical protein N184_11480 [Sinorhizobium sp. GL28]
MTIGIVLAKAARPPRVTGSNAWRMRPLSSG